MWVQTMMHTVCVCVCVCLYCVRAFTGVIVCSLKTCAFVMQNLFWLLEDAPLATYLPIHGTVSFMHLLAFTRGTAQILHQPLLLLSSLGLFLFLGALHATRGWHKGATAMFPQTVH